MVEQPVRNSEIKLRGCISNGGTVKVEQGWWDGIGGTVKVEQ